MNIVAERLNIALANKGITARELAKRSGVSESNISHYRKGDYMPKRDILFRMASVLEVSPVWLSGLDFANQSIEELWMQLNEANRKQARNYIMYLITQQED